MSPFWSGSIIILSSILVQTFIRSPSSGVAKLLPWTAFSWLTFLPLSRCLKLKKTSVAMNLRVRLLVARLPQSTSRSWTFCVLLWHLRLWLHYKYLCEKRLLPYNLNRFPKWQCLFSMQSCTTLIGAQTGIIILAFNAAILCISEKIDNNIFLRSIKAQAKLKRKIFM